MCVCVLSVVVRCVCVECRCRCLTTGSHRRREVSFESIRKPIESGVVAHCLRKPSDYPIDHRRRCRSGLGVCLCLTTRDRRWPQQKLAVIEAVLARLTPREFSRNARRDIHVPRRSPLLRKERFTDSSGGRKFRVCVCAFEDVLVIGAAWSSRAVAAAVALAAAVVGIIVVVGVNLHLTVICRQSLCVRERLSVSAAVCVSV